MNRRFLIVAAALFAAGAAIAQDAKPIPVLVDPVPLTVSRATLQVIGKGVMKLPYEEAAPVLNDLQAQLTKADQAATEEARKIEEEKAKAAKPANDNEKPKQAPAAAAK